MLFFFNFEYCLTAWKVNFWRFYWFLLFELTPCFPINERVGQQKWILKKKINFSGNINRKFINSEHLCIRRSVYKVIYDIAVVRSNCCCKYGRVDSKHVWLKHVLCWRTYSKWMIRIMFNWTLSVKLETKVASSFS